MRILYAMLIALIVTGCATQLKSNQAKVDFNSNPPGAIISTENGNFGHAPATLIWTLNNGQATAVSEPVTATWVSGATSTIRINLTAGKAGAYTINRPQGVAGLDADIQWAINLQQASQRKREADAAALAATLKNYNDNWERNNRQPTPTTNTTTIYTQPTPAPIFTPIPTTIYTPQTPRKSLGELLPSNPTTNCTSVVIDGVVSTTCR